MIVQRFEFVETSCDACGKNLLTGHKDVNYGLMESSFGYGSRLDDMGCSVKFYLCEDCWEKALSAIGKSYKSPED